MRLSGKVTIVTGASAGIGLACARRFAAEGAKVVLADVNEERGEAAAATLQDEGREALFVRCDVGAKKEVDALIADTVDAYGRLDVMIANAGIVHAADFLDLEEEDFDRVLRINLKGVFLCGQAAARQMAAQGEGGSIITMSSVNAVMAIPSITPYVVSKGGVNQLTKVMALALADKGIRVNAIGPGSIMTEVLQSVAGDKAAMHKIMSRTPMGRVGEPDEIASVAVFLASDDASYVTGQCIYADGGRLALNYTVPVKG
ncbi:SDR family NAD(P)-dependent oxidoreductase [Caenispirillum bisanense]|uniref:NAD(P)-dependent dehydrogenase, short-chain alcohol dehydrogenase family n=1 Tax=Caenispirillum bisanense TaxID=414052 RepID=A0A286GY39_9PROT|nr:SDR family oxidoreductase [Caenispirillum bisanense]SOD99994.1 NAD(P)-dependent dehydrogenase, short-chain alcohol dehydrogenase family [Caenispirillum bisanense]